jgi:thymidine kinase
MSSKNPSFKVITGPMFASKTTKVLMMLNRLKYQGKKTVLFKPDIDNRYSDTSVVTHDGSSEPAYVVKTGADIIERISKLVDTDIDTVIIDEAFMISGVSEASLFLYKNGINIIVSTLDISASGKSFKEIEKMLPWATHIEKCTAVCVVCGANAPYTYKKHVNEDSEEIQVGGDELYEPRCLTHHPIINEQVK